MNAWNDTGKYIYFTEAGISVTELEEVDGIYTNSIKEKK